MRPPGWYMTIVALGLAVTMGATYVLGQRGGAFRASRDHPAIAYTDGPVDNAVRDLNRRLEEGSLQLTFDGRSGYLRSVLDVLAVPVESQVAVFSPTSNQDELIAPDNPRAIYFADSVAVGWVRDAPLLEIAAHDRQQGTVFYTLPQTPSDAPRFTRNNTCLACHLSWDTLGVPGLQVLSMAPLPDDPNAYASGFVTDHRSRLVDRWGGWYVTGSHGGVAHMGNVEVMDVEDPTATLGLVPPAINSLEGLFDLDGYPTAHSDIVALLVLDHQTHMTNLITRVGWEARRVLFRDEGQSTDDPRFVELMEEAASELVDYLLFVDEAPLPDGITGSTRFTETFAERGPRDDAGRSLREISLDGRLFRYPCSYMIYTDAFDGLPDLAKEAIYARIWEVLSGAVTESPYSELSLADRQAVVEILSATKPDLPGYFGSVTR